MPVIPNTKRTRLDVQWGEADFLTSLELPELVTIDVENRSLTYRMNQSRLQLYMDCWRRFYWKMVENLDVGKPILRLELGSGFHEGLAQLGAGAPMSTAIDKAKKRFLLEFKDELLMPGDAEELDTSCRLIERMLPEYVEAWSRQPWVPLGLEVAGTVVVGTLEINGATWTCQLVFKIDRLVNWNGQLWIVDHKTMAKNDDRDINKYAMDIQMTAYTYAATKLLERQGAPGGLPPRVQGVIVDALIKTATPQFRREPFFRTDAELVEFQYDWLGWSEKIIRDKLRAAEFERHGVPGKLAFAKNTKSCYNYGTCPYLQLCLRDSPINRAAFVKRRPDYAEDQSAAGGV